MAPGRAGDCRRVRTLVAAAAALALLAPLTGCSDEEEPDGQDAPSPGSASSAGSSPSTPASGAASETPDGPAVTAPRADPGFSYCQPRGGRITKQLRIKVERPVELLGTTAGGSSRNVQVVTSFVAPAPERPVAQFLNWYGAEPPERLQGRLRWDERTPVASGEVLEPGRYSWFVVADVTLPAVLDTLRLVHLEEATGERDALSYPASTDYRSGC